MESIKRFFECFIPVTKCNLECSYCYVIQQNQRTMRFAELQYTPEQVAYALRKERLGGTCLISICGAGETLLQREVPEIVARLLAEGHFVNLTSNGTLSRRYDELIEKCAPTISRLHVSFSMHYIELKDRGLLDTFFSNVKKIKEAGASILVQLNLCDEYLPYIDEIIDISRKEVGACPQVALTRNEKTHPMSICTHLSRDEYFHAGERFDSPLFRFTYENFNVKRREFCYAGDWSGVLDLSNGMLRKCYSNIEALQYIFDDPDAPIRFEPIGTHCRSPYCFNSSHFMSLGVIPSMNTPSYADLRNRKEAGWYTSDAEEFLGSKLSETNKELSSWQRAIFIFRTNVAQGVNKGVTGFRNIMACDYRILKKKLESHNGQSQD